jgi:hypothetical protein
MKGIDLPPDLTERSEDLPPKLAKKRWRTKQTVGLEERLAQWARDDRDRARSLPHGEERDDLLRRARQTEQATRMTEWLTTPSSKRKM